LYLTQGLIKNNPGAHGQIEAADMRIRHGNGITAVRIERKSFFRQALSLTTEYQAVSGTERSPVIRAFCFGGKEKELVLIVLIKKLIKILPV
jgi:hypothetical protein